MADSKARRYDRQLRIWGEQGQARLESAHVCLLNCGPTGSEALKNLVLGGIGAFTIVDNARVTALDLTNNFLVESSALGSSRAACVAGLLTELNESVSGAFVEEEPARLVADPSFFKAFSLVFATQLVESDVLLLDASCRELGIPLVVARSYGLFGLVRNSVAVRRPRIRLSAAADAAQEHLVVESKPDTVLDDLRVTAPWPELAEFCAGFDLAACDDLTHRHVPYLVLLVKALSAWRAAHGGAVPASSAERRAFKESLRAMERSLEQENVKEALAAAHHSWASLAVPADVQLLLDDPAVEAAASAPSASTPDFWLLAAALRAFVAAEGALPLPGHLPDMTATTDTYVHLQRLYASKASADMEALGQHAAALLHAAGRPASSLSRDLLRSFCKNASYLVALRSPSLCTEAEPAGRRAAHGHPETLLARSLAAEADPVTRVNASIYVLFRSADRFKSQYGRFPGAHDGELDEDASRLKSVSATLLADAAPGLSLPDDLVAEMCRFGASELHCVAAIVGALASQEAIKLTTHQFVPLASSPLVYNGIASTTSLLHI